MPNYYDLIRQQYTPSPSQRQQRTQQRYGPDVTYRGGQYYADGRQFSSPEDLLKYQNERTRVGQFNQKLAAYDAESLKYRDDLLRMFGQATELNVARQGRGIMASVGQAIQRRGLQDSGVAASLITGARGQLASQATQANLDFTSRLGLLMQQERDAFVRGEFDFLNRLEAMRYGTELQKELAQFQANLASDQQKLGGFLSFVNTLGGLAASFIPGGSAVSSATGGLTQSDQFQYQYGL